MAIDPSSPRSRRALLAAAVGGLGAFVASAVARVPAADAAAGDTLVIGAGNDAGSSQTVVLSSAPGATFTVKDSVAGGTGMFGWSAASSQAGRGLYGRSDSPDGLGVQARNNAGGAGAGAALQAIGGQNNGVDASTATNSRYAIKGISTSTSAGAIAIHGEVQGASPGLGSAAVRGLIAGSTNHGTGVVGEHSGSGVGVFGSAAGDNGHGVYGLASGSDARAVQGDATGPNGIGAYGSTVSGVGVYGTATSGVGVVGTSATGGGGTFSSDSGIGILGSSVGSYAGAFVGPVHVTKHLDIDEIPTPTLAPAGMARLFARDNGAGKAQLCVIFPSGAEIVLATEA